MSMESLIFNALKGLVANNQVFPEIAKETAVAPYITYSMPGGGQAVNFVDGTQPSKKNARVQINVWALSLSEALRIAQQAETILRATVALSTTVQTDQRTRYEPDTGLYGTYQFFSCWADISS